MPWEVGAYAAVGIEHWTEQEWGQLCEAERPQTARFLPGCGWIVCKLIDGQEKSDFSSTYWTAKFKHDREKGIETACD